MIKDMLTSPILAELYELKSPTMNLDEALGNWFSVQSSLRVYDNYLRLDADRNGMLKKEEVNGKIDKGFRFVRVPKDVNVLEENEKAIQKELAASKKRVKEAVSKRYEKKQEKILKNLMVEIRPSMI